MSASVPSILITPPAHFFLTHSTRKEIARVLEGTWITIPYLVFKRMALLATTMGAQTLRTRAQFNPSGAASDEREQRQDKGSQVWDN